MNSAFAELAEQHVTGVLVVSDNFAYSRRDQIIALAARYSIPMMHPFRGDAAAGGLPSYGTSFTDAYRQVGVYVGRILKGAKPADLPVVQATYPVLSLCDRMSAAGRR